MSALPTFSEMRHKAMRQGKAIICQVLMANDDVKTVRFGPRGGWSFIA